jgi:hypothetical protein
MFDRTGQAAGVRPREEACARCGAAFECGMKAGAERCWCADFPPVRPDQALGGCLCPGCLEELLRQQGTALGASLSASLAARRRQ